MLLKWLGRKSFVLNLAYRTRWYPWRVRRIFQLRTSSYPAFITHTLKALCKSHQLLSLSRETEAQACLSWAVLGQARCDGHPLHGAASHQGHSAFLTPCHVPFSRNVKHLNTFCSPLGWNMKPLRALWALAVSRDNGYNKALELVALVILTCKALMHCKTLSWTKNKPSKWWWKCFSILGWWLEPWQGELGLDVTTLSPFYTVEKTEAWQRKATCCWAETVRAKSLKILPALWSCAGCPALHPSDNAREGITTCQYDSRWRNCALSSQ